MLRLAGTNIRRFGAFAALAGGVLHLLAFLKRTESLRLNVGMMNEEVVATIIGLDKSKALFLVKPLDSSSTQITFSSGSHGSLLYFPRIFVAAQPKGKVLLGDK
jgi:hypothetical protein